MKRFINITSVVVFAISIFMQSCQRYDIDSFDDRPYPPTVTLPPAEDDDLPPGIPVLISADTRYQTIEGFAASDANWAQVCGKFWSAEENEKAAKWLFDTKFNETGEPNGIGLSIYRFQMAVLMLPALDKGGDKSGQLSYLHEDGVTYDYTKQTGQRWYANKAKEYGVNKFIAYTPSPVRIYTKNNSPDNPAGDLSANIKDDKYDDLATYYANVIQYYKNNFGITFDYFSPVNEPQWKRWTYRNQDIKRFVVELDKQFVTKSLPTKIVVSEAAEWNHLYEKTTSSSNVNSGSLNQIEEFYKSSSANYIGNLPSVAKIMSSHSYFTDRYNSHLKNYRTSARGKADEYGLQLWQSEWCVIASGSNNPIDGFTPNQYNKMDYGLQLSKVMHSDLSYANVTSWHYWTIWNTGSTGNDCLLQAVQGPGSSSYPADRPGKFNDHKTLWSMGNYTLFVRPGYQRIKMTGAEDLASVFGSAYISPDEKRVVMIFTNMLYDNQYVYPNKPLVNGKAPVKSQMFRTDYYKNLANLKNEANIELESAETVVPENYDNKYSYFLRKRSVTTLVFDYE